MQTQTENLPTFIMFKTE